MDEKLKAQTGAAAASANAMERSCTFLPHGCRMFQVIEGWESAMIRQDKSVRTCDTLLTLEEAVKDEDVQVIFIPQGALITDEGIEKVCQRNGVTKTLFKEVKKI